MKKHSLIFIGLILFSGLIRLFPHPWNFTPILAACIFSGYKIKPVGLSLIIPLIAIFSGDLFLGFYDGMVWVYSAYIATIGLAIISNKSNNFKTKSMNVVFGSLIFFIISNFGVWMSGLIYPQTFEGLLACYIAAIPFYKNTIIGTIIYSGLFFGISDYIEKQSSVEITPVNS